MYRAEANTVIQARLLESFCSAVRVLSRRPSPHKITENFSEGMIGGRLLPLFPDVVGDGVSSPGDGVDGSVSSAGPCKKDASDASVEDLCGTEASM